MGALNRTAVAACTSIERPRATAPPHDCVHEEPSAQRDVAGVFGTTAAASVSALSSSAMELAENPGQNAQLGSTALSSFGVVTPL